MKKLLISLVVCATILSTASVAIQAGAQEMTLAQLVELFIGLGIIAPDKADAARAAVGKTLPPVATSTSGVSVSLKIGSGYTPVSQYVVGGSSIVGATYNFTTTNSPIVIKEMNFMVTKGVTSVTVGGLTAPVVSGQGATVTGLNISVPVGYAGVNVPVTLTFSNVGLNGVPSNTVATLRLNTFNYTTSNGLAVSTDGPGSGSLAAPMFSLVSSKPNITLVQPRLSDVTSGVVEVARLTIAADSKGSIRIYSIPLDSFALGGASYDTYSAVRVNSVSLPFTMTGYGVINLVNGYDISAGSSVIFSIYKNVNLPIGGSVTTKLGLASLFRWADVNGNTSFDGGLIPNYPTNSVVVSNGDYVPPVATDLKVSLAKTSPSALMIVEGQSSANLVEYTFTNTSATPAVVTNVTLARGGVSADTSLSSVYLFDGAVRLTDAATVSSGKITFNSSAGLFTVPAGASKTISVKANINLNTRGQSVSISLIGLTASTPISAEYPISGALMTITNVTDVVAATLGPVADTGSSMQPNFDGGIFWQAPLTITKNAVYLKSAQFKVLGSLPTPLKNWRLIISGPESGLVVASVASQDLNGYVVFDLRQIPYRIDSSKTIQVVADVVNGLPGTTYQIILEKNSDLQLVDSNYNVGIPVSGVPAIGKLMTINSIVQTSTNIKITDSKIKLDYDSARKESLLTAKFSGKVSAGSNSLTIGNWANISFKNDNAPGIYSNASVNSSKTDFKIVKQSSGVVSSLSSKQIIIPANGYIEFETSITANPKEMFAGVYRGVFSGIYNFSNNNYFGDSITTNNSVTVVGETSPYVTSVSYVPNITNGFNGIKIEGVRLDGSTLSSVNCSSGASDVKPISGLQNSTSLSFTIGGSVSGWCNLQLTNAKGNSNNFGFEVKSTVPNSIIINTPMNGDVYDNGPDQNIIVSWKEYSGDFEYYKVSIHNNIANVGGQISDQISKYSNGYSIVSKDIKTLIEKLSGKTAPENGYYVSVSAIKNDLIGEATVASGISNGSFNIKSFQSNNPSVSVYWNPSGTYNDSYMDPRFMFNGKDSVPFDDDATAAKFCSLVPNKNYVSGKLVQADSWVWNGKTNDSLRWTGTDWALTATKNYLRKFSCSSVAQTVISVAINSHKDGQTIQMDDYFAPHGNTTGRYLAQENFTAQINGGVGFYKAKWIFDRLDTPTEDASMSEDNFTSGNNKSTQYIFNDSGTWKVSLSVTNDKGNTYNAAPITVSVAPKVATVIDKCLNIAGTQSTVPSGYITDENGNCAAPTFVRATTTPSTPPLPPTRLPSPQPARIIGPVQEPAPVTTPNVQGLDSTLRGPVTYEQASADCVSLGMRLPTWDEASNTLNSQVSSLTNSDKRIWTSTGQKWSEGMRYAVAYSGLDLNSGAKYAGNNMGSFGSSHYYQCVTGSTSFNPATAFVAWDNVINLINLIKR